MMNNEAKQFQCCHPHNFDVSFLKNHVSCLIDFSTELKIILQFLLNYFHRNSLVVYFLKQAKMFWQSDTYVQCEIFKII